MGMLLFERFWMIILRLLLKEDINYFVRFRVIELRWIDWLLWIPDSFSKHFKYFGCLQLHRLSIIPHIALNLLFVDTVKFISITLLDNNLSDKKPRNGLLSMVVLDRDKGHVDQVSIPNRWLKVFDHVLDLQLELISLLSEHLHSGNSSINISNTDKNSSSSPVEHGADCLGDDSDDIF